MDAAEFALHMEKLIDAGANLIGGCCGSTPEFIGRIATLAGRKEKKDAADLSMKEAIVLEKAEHIIYLASEREVYTFTPGQKLVVGTEIDFSKNDELVEEYREEAFDTAVDLAFDMEDEEADIIRICAAGTWTGAEMAEYTGNVEFGQVSGALPEAKAILAVAEELSRNVNLPLMIASESVETIAYVVRHFSGIMAIQWSHNLEEWETEIKSIAKSYQVPLVTIDNEIIYC